MLVPRPSWVHEFWAHECGPAMRSRPARGPPDGVDPIVIHSLTIRRAALAALAAIAMSWSGPHPAFAQAPSTNARVSASGSFLAAQHATRERDAAAAANFYRSALRS